MLEIFKGGAALPRKRKKVDVKAFSFGVDGIECTGMRDFRGAAVLLVKMEESPNSTGYHAG